ncbi:MAG: LacI family transcriptional regulator, partial [Mesorhizobium sp.]
DDDTVSAIGVDNVAGARLAAQHLAELGHRRFAVLALPFADGSTGLVSPEKVRTALYTGTRDRLVGYFEAFSRYGVDTGGIPVYET